MSIVVEFTNCEETLCYDVIDRFCFSKQKSAYDRRIRDWSSDVCSSDLEPLQHPGPRLPRAMSGSVRLRLLAVGFELLQDTLHLVLGQQDRLADLERTPVLHSQGFHLDRERQSLVEVRAERDHAVIGEQAGAPPLQRRQRMASKFMRAEGS